MVTIDENSNTTPSYVGDFKTALEFDRRCRALESLFTELTQRITVIENEISHIYD
jgi:hypothetical protein